MLYARYDSKIDRNACRIEDTDEGTRPCFYGRGIIMYTLKLCHEICVNVRDTGEVADPNACGSPGDAGKHKSIVPSPRPRPPKPCTCPVDRRQP